MLTYLIVFVSLSDVFLDQIALFVKNALLYKQWVNGFKRKPISPIR